MDLKRQGSFLVVKKTAASLALLLVVWGRSLLCTLGWWLIHCEICKWHCHGDARDTALCHTRTTTLLPRAGWFSQSVGPQWLYPVLGFPSPGDAEALVSAFPRWTLAFCSQGDSLASMLSVTHLSGWILLLSGMLWHPLLKILLVVFLTWMLLPAWGKPRF